MATKDFFSKLKNYNNELEQVLEKKEFSSDIKNLLLSMFYKTEVAYNDYEQVKRITKDKNDFMENLIQIIARDCNKIDIVEPNSKKGQILKNHGMRSISDLKNKKIIAYPVESDMLYAIANLERTYYYIKDEHYIESIVFKRMLKSGYCMEIKEIIRDFSGWSWKIEANEIENIYYNLIYQNLRILIGNKFLEEWKIDNNKNQDYIYKLKEKISHLYGAQNSVLFLKNINEALALILEENNTKMKEELIQENKATLEELEIIKNKAKYLEKLTKDKKELTKRIKEIDEIVNNEDLLKKELEKRKKSNEKMSKVLNLSYLKGVLNEERRALIEKIQKNTQIMNPKNYVKNKQFLEEKSTNISDTLEIIEKESIYDSILDLQKQFLKCIEIKVKNTNNKKEIIDLIYYLRYYVYLPLTQDEIIKDSDKLRMSINKIEENLIAKCINLKIINPITSDNDVNFKVLKNTLLSSSINLEELEIEITPKYNKLIVNIYEGEEMENGFEIETEGPAEKVSIKNNRKFRLFIK